jgi:hypothetical protein
VRAQEMSPFMVRPSSTATCSIHAAIAAVHESLDAGIARDENRRQLRAPPRFRPAVNRLGYILARHHVIGPRRGVQRRDERTHRG